jgi:hypothetical protein
MLRMCVYMHSHFVENHPIRILEDGPLISEGVLSQCQRVNDYRLGCVDLACVWCVIVWLVVL